MLRGVLSMLLGPSFLLSRRGMPVLVQELKQYALAVRTVRSREGGLDTPPYHDNFFLTRTPENFSGS